MVLSDERQVTQVWDAFADANFQYASESGELRRLDEVRPQRQERLQFRQGFLQEFISEEIDLTTFKGKMASECARHKLWGFSGFSGQMFFNQLVSSVDPDKGAELTQLLREILVAPNSHSEAANKLDQLQDYVKQIRSHVEKPQSAPSEGSIPYFLSYFWQIQEPDTYPIYYKSMRRVLSDLAIWESSSDLAQDYNEFWMLNEEIRETIEDHTGDEIHLWTIERMCLFWLNRNTIKREETRVSEQTEQTTESAERGRHRSLPDSYIPPIVAVLPELAQNDEELGEVIDEMGRAVETLFEDRLAKCLRMLGYSVEERGQGTGRNPDGIATAQRYNYAIIYDAKVRHNGYRLATADERQFRDYINAEVESLRRQGIRNIYFAVVSSTFDTGGSETVRRLKIETDIQEVRLIEVSSLLELLETRLRDPEFSVGPSSAEGPGMQDFFAESGVLTEGDVQEQLGR